MSTLRPELLAKLMPGCQHPELHAEPLDRAMTAGEINTWQRRAAFLAQVAHESGELRYAEELASGDAYETRVDLGNTPAVDGDGRKYKGRGWLQITGRSNYQRCGQALKLDLLAHPDLLATPENAARSAAWYWSTRRLNALADRDEFGAITRVINGGYNGLDKRIAHWVRMRRILGL